jgi:hypothetical protein
VHFVPNNFNFPALTVADVREHEGMPTKAVRALLTATYTTAAGCLRGFNDADYTREGGVGIIAPTIAHADRTNTGGGVGYQPNTNFFDPDSFLTLSALMYSGDPYLLKRSREVIERTSSYMCGVGIRADKEFCKEPIPVPSSSSSSVPVSVSAERVWRKHGQQVHHLTTQAGEGGTVMKPVYTSIAKSTQLGPNIFLTLSLLKYVALTADYDWFDKMFPYVHGTAQFLMQFFDSSVGLFTAPGPLWIDVLIRENYTSDSNAMLVPTLRLLADAFDVHEEMQAASKKNATASPGDKALATPVVTAKLLRETSDRVVVAMNKELWGTSPLAGPDDHYVTQVDPSGERHDFVDYDSNLLAVAFGVSSRDRGELVLKRVDAGKNTHTKPTWVSEVPYDGYDNCYIKEHGTKCGDSIVAIGRVAWADALARQAVGGAEQQNKFDSLILDPIVELLLKNTWLPERCGNLILAQWRRRGRGHMKTCVHHVLTHTIY